MSQLKKRLLAKQKASKKKFPESTLPTYENGGYVPFKKKKIPVKQICFLGVVVLLLIAIYLPEWLYKAPEVENNLLLFTDFEAVKSTNEYTRDCPEEDFDGDGLVNYLEQQFGCSPRRIDTDGDGISDYAEIYLTESNPTVYDNGLMEKQVRTILDKEGKNLTDPYKLEGVILWADDLTSRAFGGVVRTRSGYRFSNFSGWAEFPENAYVYRAADERYMALKYREDSNAWRIDGDCEVYLLDEPLSFTHQLHFAVWDCTIPDNFFGKALSAILPDHVGFLTCSPKAIIDSSVSEMTAKHIVTPEFDPDNKVRFGCNHNSLDDLRGVYEQIDSGSCVLASLNSANAGESLILIYGYTGEGHLLIADPKTAEPAGILYVKPAGASVIAADGTLVQITYFEFFGLGFDSSAYDRIHFIAASTAE